MKISIFRRLKPDFWDHEDVASGPYKHLFDLRRIWKMVVTLMAIVIFVPIIFLTLIDYRATRNSVESEIALNTSRLISNTRRSVSFFLAERRSALRFVVVDNDLEELKDPSRLAVILRNLNKGFGGFEDLGLIDSLGRQIAYAGPYKL